MPAPSPPPGLPSTSPSPSPASSPEYKPSISPSPVPGPRRAPPKPTTPTTPATPATPATPTTSTTPTTPRKRAPASRSPSKALALAPGSAAGTAGDPSAGSSTRARLAHAVVVRGIAAALADTSAVGAEVRKQLGVNRSNLRKALLEAAQAL